MHAQLQSQLGAHGQELVDTQDARLPLQFGHSPLAQTQALSELRLRELLAFARALQNNAQLRGRDESLSSSRH